MNKIKLLGFATKTEQTISSRHRLPLPEGTFRVMDAWDERLSNYTVTVSGGKLVQADSDESGARVDLSDVWHYLASPANRYDRLGQLLDALSASTSQPDSGPGREEEFMMGEH
jgi:hypothetical protein